MSVMPPKDPLDANPRVSSHRLGEILLEEMKAVAAQEDVAVVEVVGNFLKSSLRRYQAEQEHIAEAEVEANERLLAFLRWAVAQGWEGEEERDRLVAFLRWGMKLSKQAGTLAPKLSKSEVTKTKRAGGQSPRDSMELRSPYPVDATPPEERRARTEDQGGRRKPRRGGKM